MTTSVVSEVGRLPLSAKLSYATGQVVETIVGSTLNIFLLFYVTVVCGLPGGLAGAALAAGLIVDAVMDPLIGSLSDGWNSRFGRRVPFMALGTVLVIATFILIFSLPSGLGNTALFLWLMLLSVLLRISLSLFSLPYQALGAELSEDYDERSSIAAWRWGIGMLGTLVVIVLGYGVFLSGHDGISRREGYQPFVIALSATLAIGAFITMRMGFATNARRPVAIRGDSAVHTQLLSGMAEMLRNRTFRILFLSAVLLNVGGGVHSALGLHAGIYFWHLTSAQLQGLALAAVAGLVLGAPMIGPFLPRLEKRTLMIAGMTGLVITHSIPTLLGLTGLLPLEGTGLTASLACSSFLVGVFTTMAVIAFLSIIADATDEHELLFGTRREGLYFAGWSFAAKAASGGGLFIAGLVLQMIGFPEHVADAGGIAAVLPEKTVALLAAFYGPGAGLLSVAGILVAMLYRLNKRTHGNIMEQLKARRAEAGVLPSI